MWFFLLLYKYQKNIKQQQIPEKYLLKRKYPDFPNDFNKSRYFRTNEKMYSLVC